MDYVCYYKSPMGKIMLAADDSALVGLWFEGQKFFADTLNEVYQEKINVHLEETLHWLDLYFDGLIPNFTPSTFLRTTAFRRSVGQIMQTIPYGSTTTYGDIASSISPHSKRLAQAVGNAVGHNPISLIIPCHRVIGANGKITGYAAGIDKKIKLLQWEHDVVAKF